METDERIMIPSYEGLYEVDKIGNVYSLRSNIILRPGMSKNGYLSVVLTFKCKKKTFYVHQLVALFYGIKPKGFCINHKNGIKTDNRVENLEYCSYSKNNLHSIRELISRGSLPKEVSQFSLDNKFIRDYPSGYEAAQKLNVDNSHIYSCLNNKRKNAYGFLWKYKN